jgi:hypothetical protein
MYPNEIDDKVLDVGHLGRDEDRDDEEVEPE